MRQQSNEISFKGQNIYVGIDVHLKSWSVTVLSENSVLKRIVQDPDPGALHKFLTRNYPDAEYHSVYEAGFCGFWIHERLTALGINNIVINPADVPTTAGERIQKTDAVDSAKLARSLRNKELTGIYVPDSTSLEVRSLIRLRSAIAKDMTRQKNRIKAHLRFLGYEIPVEYCNRDWPKRFIVWLRELDMKTQSGRQSLDFMLDLLENLRKEKLDMTRALRELSRTEQYEKPLELVMSVPGIGQQVGMALLAEIVDIRRFKSAESLAKYVGLVPMCHGSGEKDGVGDITIRKHAFLRTLIVESSWVAIRQDPALTLAFETYCTRMKPSEAIIKIARKLVNRIYFVMKWQKPYVTSVVS